MHYGKDKYIGYRGLDTTNCPVAYPFGHGLSYTNFAYPGLDPSALSPSPPGKTNQC